MTKDKKEQTITHLKKALDDTRRYQDVVFISKPRPYVKNASWYHIEGIKKEIKNALEQLNAKGYKRPARKGINYEAYSNKN